MRTSKTLPRRKTLREVWAACPACPEWAVCLAWRALKDPAAWVAWVVWAGWVSQHAGDRFWLTADFSKLAGGEGMPEMDDMPEDDDDEMPGLEGDDETAGAKDGKAAEAKSGGSLIEEVP